MAGLPANTFLAWYFILNVQNNHVYPLAVLKTFRNSWISHPEQIGLVFHTHALSKECWFLCKQEVIK